VKLLEMVSVMIAISSLSSNLASAIGERPCDAAIYSAPKKIYAPTPPTNAIQAMCEGFALPPVLSYVVLVDGHVGKIELLKSSGCRAADLETKRCLAYWRFEPATCSGNPVAVKQGLTINWGYGKGEKQPARDYCRPYEELEKEPDTEFSDCSCCSNDSPDCSERKKH